MIILGSGDKIQGDADTKGCVDYTITGVDDRTVDSLADGQLDDSVGDLYTADSADVIKSIILTNTDTSAHDINLYMLPSGGTARRILPVDMSLSEGYTVAILGDGIQIVSPTGQLQFVGDQGPEGPQGPEGAEGLAWQGAWDSGTTYEVDDAVTHNGHSYICTSEHTDQEPPNASYWDLLADAGQVSDLTYELELFAASGIPSSTNGCATPAQRELATNNIDIYTAAFDPDSDEYMQWGVTMPSDWDGSTITAKFVWTHQGSAGDTVRWGLQALSLSDGDAIDTAWGTAQEVDDVALASDDLHITAATSAITVAGSPSAGDEVRFRAFRNADHANDDFDNDAELEKIIVTYGISV